MVSRASLKQVGLSLVPLALVAAAGPLLIWSVNIGRIEPGIVATGIAILFAGLVVLQLAAIVLFRRPALSSVVLSLGTLALLYDGVFGIRALPAGLWLWSIGFAVLIAACLWKGKVAATTGRLVPIFLLALCVPIAWGLATNPVWGERGAIREALAKTYPAIPLPATVPVARPDIYYIIFDRYARSDILAGLYGFDNAGFLEELRSRGFTVADDTYGAYQRTAHSVSSTLNLGYIDTQGVGQGSSDWIPLYETLGSPRLFPFLKGLDYRIETYGSWWEPTRASPLADVNDAYFAVPESLRPFTENSLLATLLEKTGVAFLDPRQRHCQRLHHQFDAVSEAGTPDEPVFVFAHFLVPHPPFVLDASGRCISVEEAAGHSRVENYIGQLRFTNTEALTMVDAILARDPEAIIILQSDEGPWPARYAGEEIAYFGADISSVDWRDIPPAELREKMAILSAVRIPGVAPDALDDGFAPVNTFRIVLREVFGVPLEDLERSAFVFHNDAALYDFSPVLPILQGND